MSLCRSVTALSVVLCNNFPVNTRPDTGRGRGSFYFGFLRTVFVLFKATRSISLASLFVSTIVRCMQHNYTKSREEKHAVPFRRVHALLTS